MKNFIYLPLLAIIFLCGCKSNSFMTQRYTKLGHSSHKQGSEQFNSASKNNEGKREKHQELLTASNEQIKLAYASAVTEEAGSVDFPKKIITPLLNAGNAGVSWVKQDVKNTQTQKLDFKKTFKEKNKKAAGLFATTVRLVLFCIVVAVVIAVVIICLIVFG